MLVKTFSVSPESIIEFVESGYREGILPLPVSILLFFALSCSFCCGIYLCVFLISKGFWMLSVGGSLPRH